MKEYDYSRNYNRTNNNWGFKIISITTLLLAGFMAFSHFYELINSSLMESVQNIHTGSEPLSMSYYEPQIRSSALMLIYGILYALLFLLSLFSLAKKNIQLLYLCLTLTILIGIVEFILNETIL
ncbi:hypothetical protein JGH11_16095 [Dysgonomonas sp. Marseille-P4677]|uniref:hypothetical protein n=1 Tax=Dysgonomonas sp. Marseille-P4677 TaxID=2364790 RepID=UPI001912DFF2|nr:hypothetical protein [Dysgonomonas sp. Marseille-P4677]MBK5722398.1 hypothetical protein [Dysgonomonas sp. Marseille-P4677]